jgi:TIR domain
LRGARAFRMDRAPLHVAPRTAAAAVPPPVQRNARMELLRLFVSHSSKDPQLTAEVCGLLAPSEAEGRAGYDVRVDQRDLEDGRPWPRQLHAWMAQCHAGLLLLTANAAASPWVLKEATILSWRLSLDPSFHLFTVLGPGVDDALLRAHRFEPLGLGTIQRTAAGALDAATIAAAVRATLGQPRPGPTLEDRVVGALADVLAGVGQNTLRTVAERVHAGAPAWDPAGDARVQAIETIARQILCEDLGEYDGIDELVEDLVQTADADVVGKVLKHVASYWVDGVAAGRLAAAVERKPSRVAALNGRRVPVFTGPMYVRRAFPLKYRKAVGLGGGSAGDWVGHMKREICARFQAKYYPSLDETAVIEKLKRRGDDYIVVLPELPPLAQDLTALRAEFPSLHFLLATGEQLVRDDALGDIEWLDPPLELAVEERAEESWERAHEILEHA